jgi:hypothetical protein
VRGALVAEGGGIVIGNLILPEIVYGILWPIGCENPHTPIIKESGLAPVVGNLI